MKKLKLLVSSLVVGTITIASCAPVFAYTKEETVYTKLNPDGEETVTIVSEHLKNDDNEKTLKDLTTLSHIMNMNGDEKFTQDGKKINWESQGNDIYYQGKTEKQLPITMKITYKFNGKTTKVEDMLGKKGKVEIHIQYTNHEKRNVNGESLYVPFVVTTGTTLPTDTNRKVEVTNGKVSSNGSNHIIIALATPGLSHNFDNKELEDLSETTIKYETTNFELNSIMTVATPSLLSESDMEVFDNMDKGYSLVDQLSSSYAKIKSGGKDLSQSMNKFSSKYTQFDKGVSTLDSKSKLLVNGASKIDNGLEQLDTGLTELNKGLKQLSENSAQLRSGASQLSSQILATVNKQLKESGLDIVLTKEDYTQKLEGQINGLEQQKEQYQTQLNQLNALPDEQKQVYAQQIQQLKIGIATIDAAIPQLNGAKATLDNIFSFEKGIQDYTGGVDQAANSMPKITEGSSQLLTGSNELVVGVNALLQGTKQLSSNSKLLNSAAKQLSQGAQKLSNGINEFDEKGLSKINHFVKNDLKKNVNKTKEMIELANDYKTFTDVADGTECITKFIMIVNSKKK